MQFQLISHPKIGEVGLPCCRGVLDGFHVHYISIKVHIWNVISTISDDATGIAAHQRLKQV